MHGHENTDVEFADKLREVITRSLEALTPQDRMQRRARAGYLARHHGTYPGVHVRFGDDGVIELQYPIGQRLALVPADLFTDGVELPAEPPETASEVPDCVPDEWTNG
ncbi:hypothetical protein CEJ39_06105 [Rhodococcus pyridinivorans]|uniref:hypothetical protein n=1 Tax=Rhodococcus pyridinivorans TaxID=103816 RepID=UPI00030655FE|nr:hypothetical protein [Rhodococcus pyridinivorans]AWZ23807.1 hypothetical protein CEJ39_06105 [Rhodococcus pyridinivorans]